MFVFLAIIWNRYKLQISPKLGPVQQLDEKRPRERPYMKRFLFLNGRVRMENQGVWDITTFELSPKCKKHNSSYIVRYGAQRSIARPRTRAGWTFQIGNCLVFSARVAMSP